MPIFRLPPTRCPWVRMSLTAHSIVSEPVVSKNALLRPSGAAAPRARANSMRSAFGKQNVCRSPRSTVLRMASRISLAPWPAFATSTPELQSSHMLPNRSYTWTPSARSHRMGGWPSMLVGSCRRMVSRSSRESGAGIGVTIRRKRVRTAGTAFGVKSKALLMSGHLRGGASRKDRPRSTYTPVTAPVTRPLTRWRRKQ